MAYWTPTAGFIPLMAPHALPGPLSDRARRHLRDLAARVAEIAADLEQEQKRQLWYRHVRLEKTRPLVLVFPEDSWPEIIPESRMELDDPFWKQWEWYLKHLIYRDERICDDFVIEPDLYVTSVIREGDWGVPWRYIQPEDPRGSWLYDPPLKDPKDIAKLKCPTIEFDEEATRKRFEATCDVFGDMLPVHTYCGAFTHANLISEAMALRGIAQVMLDMYDRPLWLHELMAFISQATLRKLEYLESNDLLSLNNRNHYTDSGGIGYTKELPAPDFDGRHVRPCDMWGFGVAQELSEVGPEQHEEFVLNYQLPILEQFGLNAYGCCEPMTTKFDMVRKVPRLRRVSVSPWCDIERAAEELKRDCIYSWKPNPSLLIGRFNPDSIRAYIRKTLEVAADCALEIILKDTFTIENDPRRIETWAKVVREEIDRLW